jgi:hypothetical protein
MKKLLYMAMVIFSSQIFYASENNYPVAYTLLKISYDIAKSKLKSYEQLLNSSNTQLSPEQRRSLESVMIYRFNDLTEFHRSFTNILNLQRSQQLTQTRKFKESGMSEQEYVDKKMLEFRQDLVLCERQIKILERLHTLTRE